MSITMGSNLDMPTLLDFLRRYRKPIGVLAPLAICSCLFLFICTPIPQNVQRKILTKDYQFAMARYNAFCTSMLDENIETAYQYISPHYRLTHDQDALMWVGRRMAHGSGFGGWDAKCPVYNIEYVDLIADSASVYGAERRVSDLYFLYVGSEVNMIRLNGKWYIDDVKYYSSWDY